MSESTEQLQARLARRQRAYDRLLELGRARSELEAALSRNLDQIVHVVRSARADLHVRDAATAAGVSRQTLHRWLNLRPNV